MVISIVPAEQKLCVESTTDGGGRMLTGSLPGQAAGEAVRQQPRGLAVPLGRCSQSTEDTVEWGRGGAGTNNI